EVLAHHAGGLLRDESFEPRDAVLLVHDVIARLEIGEERTERAALAAALGMPRLAEAEDLRVGEHAQAELRHGEALSQPDAREHERSRIRRVGDLVMWRRHH